MVVLCDRNDEYILRWLTDDGLQRLTQIRLDETRSSSTDDDVDNNSGSVENGRSWANKSLWYYEQSYSGAQ